MVRLSCPILGPLGRSFSSSSSASEWKNRILCQALPLVPTYGWTRSLREACEQCGLSPLAVSAFISEGSSGDMSSAWTLKWEEKGVKEEANMAVHLIDYYMVQADQHVANMIDQNKDTFDKLGMTKKVRYICHERLQFLRPFIHTWTEAISILALPYHMPHSLHLLSRTSDQMWHLAGDTSVDFNWYTKRFLLSAVYVQTELYMTQDRSETFKDTFDFLDRQLDQVSTIGYSMRQMSQFVEFHGNSFLNLLLQK